MKNYALFASVYHATLNLNWIYFHTSKNLRHETLLQIVFIIFVLIFFTVELQKEGKSKITSIVLISTILPAVCFMNS